MLKSLGYDGIIDWSGKGGGDIVAPVYIPFGETQVKSAIGNKGTFSRASKDILKQSPLDALPPASARAEPAPAPRVAPRGQIEFGGDKAAITLFKGKDVSTLLHEMGHSWLEELARDAIDPRATAQVGADMATVRKWLGNDGGAFTKAQHEQFAQAIERYFMTGKAPSAKLEGVFAQFKDWLTQIYYTVGNLGAPISEEVHGAFDRLLSKEDTKPPPPDVAKLADNQQPANVGLSTKESLTRQSVLKSLLECLS